jgi:hypothetical protein
VYKQFTVFCKYILGPTLTSNSFSAVGLFLGFLVNAILTKLWKVGLLQKKGKKKIMQKKTKFTVLYVYISGKQQYNHVGFEVLTEVVKKHYIFGDISSCSLLRVS